MTVSRGDFSLRGFPVSLLMEETRNRELRIRFYKMERVAQLRRQLCIALRFQAFRHQR